MRLRTPHFGPHAGRLCRVLDGGELEPVPDLPEGFEAPHPVALPEGPVDPASLARTHRGRDGAALEHMRELQKAGGHPTFADCQDRVSRALATDHNKRNR